MTDPELERPPRRRSAHRLQRLRSDRRQPARGPPAADVQPPPAAAGRAPAHRRGRRRDRLRRRPRGQERGAHPAHGRAAAGQPRPASGPSSSGSSTSCRVRPRRAAGRQRRLARADCRCSISSATWASTSPSTRWWPRTRCKSRLERAEQGISYTEFSYMLLQAFDFLHLFDTYGCRLQLGGSDQWGNITMGIELIRKVRHQAAFGLTTPLVLKADGTKFGKTETGTVWLDAGRTSPYQLYQFFLRTEDAVVGTYLRYFTFLAHEEILELDRSHRRAPRAARRPAGAGPRGRAPWSTEPRRRHGPSRPPPPCSARRWPGSTRPTILDVFADAPSTTVSSARAWTERRAPGRPALRDRPGAGRRAGPGPPSEQGGAYGQQPPRGRRRPHDRGRRPRGRALRGAPAGQARVPSRPLRLIRSLNRGAVHYGHGAEPRRCVVAGAAERWPSRDRARRGAGRHPTRAGWRSRRPSGEPDGKRSVRSSAGRHGRSPAGRRSGRWPEDDVEAYACFRVGYHRGLDALRAAGWKGSGLVRWEHPSNRASSRCLDGLRSAAAAIGEHDEEERCAQFLRQLDPSWPPDDRAGDLMRRGRRPTACHVAGPGTGTRSPSPAVPWARPSWPGAPSAEESGPPGTRVTSWLTAARRRGHRDGVGGQPQRRPRCLPTTTRPGRSDGVCGLLTTDAQTAIGNLPTPDQTLTQDLNSAYEDAAAAGTDCYNGAGSGGALLAVRLASGPSSVPLLNVAVRPDGRHHRSRPVHVDHRPHRRRRRTRSRPDRAGAITAARIDRSGPLPAGPRPCRVRPGPAPGALVAAHRAVS